jgi:predicted DCC family thiol-disulfide oxidoreductase YuxK
MNYIFFYDDDCRFCDWCVRFVLRFERNSVISFAALNGHYAKAILPGELIKSQGSFVFFSDGVALTKGVALRAAARIANMRGLSVLFSLTPIRALDCGYDLVASLRYLIFGKTRRKVCESVPAHLRIRFIDL